VSIVITAADVDAIVAAVADEFVTFGGGRVAGSDFNPLVGALKDEPAMFAMGVDVKSVVLTVMRLTVDQIEAGMKAEGLFGEAKR